jgi:hypothetical protein
LLFSLSENRFYAISLALLLTTQFSMNVVGLGPALFCLAADGFPNDQIGAVSLFLTEKRNSPLYIFSTVRCGFEEHSPEVQRGLDP